MKAWVLDQPGPTETRPVKLVDLPIPEPATGQLRLRVLACGLCRIERPTPSCGSRACDRAGG